MIGPPGAGKTMLARRLPGDPAAAHLRGGARDHTRCTASAGRWATAALAARAAVPGAAPHDLVVGARRRRRDAAAGRDHARPSRRALPGRARRVLAPRARGAAPAARGGHGSGHARPALDRLPGRDHARRRRLQPLPLRARAGPMRVPADATGNATRGGSARRCSTASIWSASWSRPPLELADAGERQGESAPVRKRVVAARERQRRAPRREPAALATARWTRALTQRHGRRRRACRPRCCTPTGVPGC